MRGRVGRAILGMMGWRAVGAEIVPERCVIVVAPHTSNWDFVIGLAAAAALAVRVQWLGKHTLFKPPFGGIMRRLGGIPVDRTAAHDLVGHVVRSMEGRSPFRLALAPEGTRTYTDKWKSGFYHIARQAGVPVVTGFIDFGTKTVGFRGVVPLTGDEDADMRAIAAHYDGVRGKNQEEFGPIRL